MVRGVDKVVRMHSRDNEISLTRLLERWAQGEEDALQELVAVAEPELRRIGRQVFSSERVGSTLQPTVLVNEAFISLLEQRKVALTDRHHFFALAALLMRRALRDHSRGRRAEKRGHGWRRTMLRNHLALAPAASLDFLALGRALEKLSQLSKRQARVVELRFFSGFTVAEVAELLVVSPATVKLDWHLGRAFLRKELGDD